MPLETEWRQFEYLLELRATGEGRTLVGRAVPYGETTTIPQGKERFVMGAFNRQISSGQISQIKMYDGHSQRFTDHPIGKTMVLSERQDGLHGEWELYNTGPGRDALEMVREGEVTGLSIGFKAVEGGTKIGHDGAFERHAAHLDHVVLTHEPAYPGAQVMAIRSASQPLSSFKHEAERHHGLLARIYVPQ